MSPDNSTHLTAAPDARSAEALAARGLELRVVPPDDTAAFTSWRRAVTRGFLEPEPGDDDAESARERSAARRKTGVYDPSVPVPQEPVATFASWIGELTVPGGAGIPACAISAVTVAPTHRRRGLLRTLMAGELRLAVDQGVPIAGLTVSESTIYGRFGFAPAAAAANWTLDLKRAAWTGPVPDGRVDFITRERWAQLAAPLHERTRLRAAGELSLPRGHIDRVAGTHPGAKDAGQRRAIQYTDAAGTVRGVALYSAKENHDDFTKSTAQLHYLLAEDGDAYAALWRFLIGLDLIGELHAGELSVDEPLLWMISDQRAARVTVTDHQYVRVLDVAAALRARRFGAAGRLVLEVSDPLGHAAGRWLLEVGEDGTAAVSDAAGESDAVTVRLGVAELSAAYLGGVSLATLAAAGRVETADPDLAARVFGWHRAPRLSFWY
ncbi:MAG TPA: GNAT family N-acetyltransferase [Microbacterium sp.]|nr:GNAT family N-acetyltransferase [Microbacterium sp.]